ncbi:hypothetical protein D3C81_1198630 [compost metagenome]
MPVKKSSPATVSVDLNQYVKLYGVQVFDQVLAQVLKGFVDMGQYPSNIPGHEQLAKEIHKTLSGNGIYTGIKADDRRYQLMISEPAPYGATIYAGGQGNVIIPDVVWWVLVSDHKDVT